MRTRSLIPILGILALIVSACAQTAGPSDRLQAIKNRGTLIVGVRYNVPPYDWLNPATGKVEGFDIDVAREIAAAILGSPDKIEFKQAESDSRVAMLKLGDVDLVLATMTITDARKKEIDFSVPYYPAGIGLMVKDGSPIRGFEDLRAKTNCAGQGSAAHENLQAALQKNYGWNNTEVIRLPDTAQCVEALRAGRVDYVATDQGILIGLNRSSSGLKVFPQMLTDEPWGVGVAKDNPQLLSATNDAIKKAFANGKWLALFKKWTNQEPPPGWPPK
jgi:putative glutamine transport system substrate-binding protein